MKREDLIAQLELLPEGSEVFVRKDARIAEPYLCIYSVQPHPEPEKLVVYIETFIDAIMDRYKDGISADMLVALTEPCHEHLHHVCHHGRSIMGTCGECSTYDEELD